LRGDAVHRRREHLALEAREPERVGELADEKRRARAREPRQDVGAEIGPELQAELALRLPRGLPDGAREVARKARVEQAADLRQRQPEDRPRPDLDQRVAVADRLAQERPEQLPELRRADRVAAAELGGPDGGQVILVVKAEGDAVELVAEQKILDPPPRREAK
jgi:hypothetical protein